jgi:hypothetical protein
VTESFNFDIDMVGAITHRPSQLGPHLIERHRLQTLDFPAGLALEMGMGRVMFAGQLKMVHAALYGEFSHYAPTGKIFQYTVNGNLIHPAARPDRRQDLLSPESPGALSQNLQDRQTHRCGSQALLGQPQREIAMITHGNFILRNQLSCKFILGAGMRGEEWTSPFAPERRAGVKAQESEELRG